MLVKAPRPGFVKTRLVPPLDVHAAAALALAFAADTVAWIDALAPRLHATPFLYVTPDDAAHELHDIARGLAIRVQGDGDLGRRMHAVVATLCDDGFEEVVLVGADSPTLPESCVRDAFAALDSGANVALARADDGGYVLLGLDAPYATLFEGIAWSTDTVYDTTLRRGRAAGLAVREIAGWYDIDTVSALARLRSQCADGASARAPRTDALLKKLSF